MGICMFGVGNRKGQKASRLPRGTSILLELAEDCAPGKWDTVKLQRKIIPPFMALGLRESRAEQVQQWKLPEGGCGKGAFQKGVGRRLR